MASALADRPDESAAEIELRHLFLPPEHQRQIMFSGSRMDVRKSATESALSLLKKCIEETYAV